MHNFKKTPNVGTWTCLKAPNPFFFNFVLVFWGVIRWNRLAILFFFGFFDIQTWEIATLECVGWVAHNYIKPPYMGTWTCLKAPNPIFFDVVPFICGDISWKRLTILLFLASLRNCAPRMSLATLISQVTRNPYFSNTPNPNLSRNDVLSNNPKP